MKMTTIEVSTEELLALAKQGSRSDFGFYQFLFEKYVQVRQVFADVAYSDANFDRFEHYCDAIMTRQDAIQYLIEAGHFNA